MNKYASGYTLVSILNVIGWVMIFTSAAIAFFVYSSAPRGFEYIGFVFLILGLFQGVILLGAGALGEAILDGARFQKEGVDILKSIDSKISRYGADEAMSAKNSAVEVQPALLATKNIAVEVQPALVANGMNDDDPSFKICTIYFGYNIRYHPNGVIVGKSVFNSVAQAQRAIDAIRKMQ